MPPPRPEKLDPVQRRIRAAMSLAGLDFPGLAREINTPNLGERTLRGLQEGKANRPQLEAIARACHLPYEFFTADFDTLEPGPAGLEQLTQLLRAHDTYVREQTARLEIERISRRLTDLERTSGTLLEVAEQVRTLLLDLRPSDDELARMVLGQIEQTIQATAQAPGAAHGTASTTGNSG